MRKRCETGVEALGIVGVRAALRPNPGILQMPSVECVEPERNTER